MPLDFSRYEEIDAVCKCLDIYLEMEVYPASILNTLRLIRKLYSL